MASSGKKKTTMAKLARESKLRERRQEKKAKKEARRNAPPVGEESLGEALNGAGGESHEEPLVEVLDRASTESAVHEDDVLDRASTESAVEENLSATP